MKQTCSSFAVALSRPAAVVSYTCFFCSYSAVSTWQLSLNGLNSKTNQSYFSSAMTIMMVIINNRKINMIKRYLTKFTTNIDKAKFQIMFILLQLEL